MSKEKEVENYYDKREIAEDSIKSSHSELARSADYANSERYSLDQLRDIAIEWGEQADNPIRSARSREVCRIISLRATFECACLLNRVDVMVECYRALNEQTLAA